MLSHERASKRSHGRDTLKEKEKKITKTAINLNLVGKTGASKRKHLNRRKRASEAEPGFWTYLKVHVPKIAWK